MKKVDTKRKQAAEMRMIRMCGKTLRDGILNGLLRNRTRVENRESSLGLGTHLFVKLPRPGDSERIFSVFVTSGKAD